MIRCGLMTRSLALSASVGRLLRELRVASGVSVGRLARQAGLPSRAVLAIEQGRGQPTIATLEALARPLHVSVLDLVQVAGAAPPATPGAGLDDLDAIANAITELPDDVGDKLDAVGAAVVRRALEVCDGNRSAAARLLGMERKALHRRWERVQRETKPARRRSV
jgi:transcriptional regulator with XRE-family HTH domain